MNHLGVVIFVFFPYMVVAQTREEFQAEIFLNKNDLNSGLYEGTVLGRRLFTSSAKPHGRGTIYYFNNDKFHRVNYTGDWVNGNRHGKGKTYFRDGSVYTGDYKEGVEEGEGTITYEDGNILKGEFSDGKIHGHAVFRYPNGDQREGFFFENVLDGQVIYTKADGMIVIELWKNGENLESKSQIVRPSNSVVQSTIQTPTTVEILKPVTKSKSVTTQEPNNVSSTTESNRLSTSFDINALRKAIRSGDRTQMFSSNPREPRIQTESMDVKKLREETDIANEEFLRSVFLRVNG